MVKQASLHKSRSSLQAIDCEMSRVYGVAGYSDYYRSVHIEMRII